jgi:hypothetical protein
MPLICQPPLRADLSLRCPVWICVALYLAACLGCGGRTAESYVPANDVARAGLERALQSWHAGGAAGRIEPPAGGQAALQAVDTDWSSGRKLASFEILSELPREDGPRKFSVRLTLVGAAVPMEVTYFVVGQDPVWIFRDRDYAQTMTM